MREIEITTLQSLPQSDNLREDITHILTEARRVTAKAVNKTMVVAYWLIGKRIVIEEQKGADRAEYGEGLLKKLSKELSPEFGSGLSYPNLYKMRQFYMTYRDNEILSTLWIKLAWSHNCLIMRVADPNARELLKDPYVLELKGQTLSAQLHYRKNSHESSDSKIR